ncbi:TolC family protein [Persephonella sp.]|nr:TolC family protein [Aquificota bacterium]
MKKILAGLLATYCISYGITLDELINRAVQTSPVLKEKQVEAKIQQARKKSIRGSRFGSIDVFVNGVRYENTRILYPLTPPIDPRRLVGARNQLITGIRYSLPLFTGFEIEKNVEISSISEKVKNIDYRLTKNQLIYNIKSVYLKILELQKQTLSLNAYRDSLKKLYDDVRLAVDLGKKPETDLLKVEYQLKDVESQISRVKNSIVSLKETLRSLVGDDSIDLSEIEDVKITQYVQTEEGEYRQRIGSLDILKKAEMGEKIAVKKLEIAKGKYLPRVFLNASAQRNMGNSEYKDLWQIGFTVEFTLFDFGRRKHQYIQSKLEVEKARLEKQILKLKVREKIADALSQIKSASSAVEAAKKQIDYAKKVEEVERAKYMEGVTDMFNYLYAKSQRLMAETSFYNSLYERERAIAYLKYILEEYKDE